MNKDTFDRHTTITGRVTLHEDNEGIDILTDEDVYAVELDYVGEQLIDFIDETIRAAGFVSKYSDEDLQIMLDDYELLDEDTYTENIFEHADNYPIED